ncbi:Eukaryotic translation initiation factor 2 subunit 1, partial [Coemansia erecta]
MKGCRYYKAKYPSPGDIVMATIERISDDEIGAYVKLEEYAGLDGMIPLSELSRRRIRS